MPESLSGRVRFAVQRLRVHIRGIGIFCAGVLAALLAFLLYGLLAPSARPLTQREVNDTVAHALASATAPPANSTLVFQAIHPSLILIETHNSKADPKEQDGVGSGVIVTDKGDILTSLHVVTDAETIEVTFADGTKSRAQIVAAQPENDIAVVRASTLPKVIVAAALGNPSAIQIGDEAFVVGNPLGLYGSMSSGVISALNRSFKPDKNRVKLSGLIQIDAAVNPGNSGGPLLNRNGEVIGIVAALVNPTGQDVFIGIGFAVPINVAGGAAGLPPY